MIAPVTTHTVKYKIQIDPQGVLLRIWEPALEKPGRMKPFLFAMNYKLASEQEAKAMLNDYLIASGAHALEAAKMSSQGILNILPFPTDDKSVES